MKSSRGAAIIASLFMLILVALLVSAMMHRQSLAISRAQSLTGYYRLYFAAQGALHTLMQSLEKDLEADPKALKGLDSKVYRLDFPPDIKGEIHLSALGGRFNINNLNHPAEQMLFKRLLMLQHTGLSDDEASDLIQAIVEMGFSQRNMQRVMSEHDRALSQSYHSSRSDLMPLSVNLGLVSVSQIRSLPQMTRGRYLQLAPFLIALPSQTAIDINAAPTVLLQALSQDIDLTTAQSIIDTRSLKSYDSVADFLKLLSSQGKSLSQSLISDQSQYFLVTISVKLAKQSLMIYSILSTIPASQNSKIVTLLWQTQSAL